MNSLQRENWKEGEGMWGWMVNVSGVNRLASDLEGKHTTIGAVRVAVGNIRQNLAVSGEARRTVTSVLDRIMESMEQEERKIKDMGASLYKITTAYQNCEKRIIDQNTGAVISGAVHSGSGKAEVLDNGETKKEGVSWKWKDTWNVISKAGIAGAGVSTIGNFITGNGDIKTILTSGKFLTKGIGGICSAIAKRGSRAEWSSHILGINNALNKIDTSSPGKAFTSSMNKQFGYDLDMSKAKGWEKGKVGAKWAGHALTAITTALGATAAPVVAVGAAAAVAIWAVNGVCKWVTGGKDVGEAGQYLFNHEDIEEIYFKGYDDEERGGFIESLSAYYQE